MKTVSMQVKRIGKEIIAKVITDAKAATREEIETFCKGITKYLVDEWADDEEHSITVYPRTPKNREIRILK